MAQFQVVAVGQTTGTRFFVRDVWGSFLDAEWHRKRCLAAWPDEKYQIDMVLADGSVRHNVDGVRDLGYSSAEIADVL